MPPVDGLTRNGVARVVAYIRRIQRANGIHQGTRPMKNIAITALMIALTNGAFAHSRIDATTPADGATLAEVPAEISVTFADDIRLTRVEVIHEDSPSVRLDLGGQTSFGTTFTLPLEDMGGGTYRIEWRGLGADGHAMRGAFMFTVK